MGYRREPRFETNHPITITDLEQHSSSFSGHLVNFSSPGIGLLMTGGLAPTTAVKVRWAGTLLLGEVIYCRSREEGH